MQKKNVFLFWLIILAIGGIWFLKSKNGYDNSNLIGAYIDGEYTNTLPGKNDGYVVEKIVCDNEAVGEWNYDDWSLLVKNMAKKSRCNIYFKKGINLADTVTLVDTSGKCPTVNTDGTVNVTSAEAENSLICMAPDNYGTSYYFRGNVVNNYVYFAGLYWRIIRVNGDGSVRMIYDGTIAHKNNEASADRSIGKSAFNKERSDNAYIGYMYGNVGSSSYEETHANINDSTIKSFIDDWYIKNIKNTEYEQYLADDLFCNDRSIDKPSDSSYTNLGSSNSKTVYRWYYGPWSGSNKNNVTFMCKNMLDSFAVSSYNKALTYPIGLISEDEVLAAGGHILENNDFYLYSGLKYWTMSPYLYSDTGVIMRYLSSNGMAHIADNSSMSYDVKPVINLKANSLKLGDGSIDNPYRVF